MNDPSNNQEASADTIPFTADELQPRPEWATVEAEQEDQKWDTLEEVRFANDKRWLTVYGYLLLAITIAFALTFMGALLAWAWHYIAPPHWHWLEDFQLSKIQSVLFSGGMGAVVSSIIRTQIGKTQ